MNKKTYIKDQVDIITLNYNNKDIIHKLLDSLRDLEYKNNKVYMVDNGSSDGSSEFVREKYPEVNVIRSEKNLFFSRGNNLAINQTNGEYLLLINSDVIVEKDSLTHLVERIKEDNSIAAVATKMMLSQYEGLLDSVGTVIMENGWPFNRGIGQPDLGQYDESEQIFGACFGCVLIRRSYYENEIGQLDNLFFGYFEDIDWCFRANILGYKIVTEPKAKVYHAHSISTKKNVPLWKLYLIHRNFIWTAQKNYSAVMAIKITYVRYRELLKEILHYKFSARSFQNLKIILVTLFASPRTLLERWKIQSKRKVQDSEITKYSIGEMPYFEDINYSPIYSVGNLHSAFEKLQRKRNTQEVQKIVSNLKSLELSITNKSEDFDQILNIVLSDLKGYIAETELLNFKEGLIYQYNTTNSNNL